MNLKDLITYLEDTRVAASDTGQHMVTLSDEELDMIIDALVFQEEMITP